VEATLETALARLATALQRRLAGPARERGIRWSALAALGDLRAHGPLSQRRLAERERMTPATISVLVRELRAEGLVAESADPRDARRRRLQLTSAGAARLDRDLERLGAVLADLPEGLSAAERRALAAALPPLLRELG